MTLYEYSTLAAWGASLPLIFYTWLRKHYDLFVALVVMFFMLSIAIGFMIEKPNPEWVKPKSVVAP